MYLSVVYRGTLLGPLAEEMRKTLLVFSRHCAGWVRQSNGHVILRNGA